MEGFFSKKETSLVSRPGGKRASCTACGLHKTCQSPRIKPYGNFKKKILNIGEAPGEFEDRTSKPWQGKVGKLLERSYAKLGINLFEDCLNINSVNCRPTDGKGNNRAPYTIEIDCCRKMVLKTIMEEKPHIIVLLGNAAIQSVIGYRWKRNLGNVTKWRGWTIPDQDFKAWIIPTFHPSFIERENEPEKEVVWMQDLKLVHEYINHPFLTYEEPDIEVIEDLSVLDKIQSGQIAIDYETTGIKPHASGHRIVCIAIADSPNHCLVFVMPRSRKLRQPFINLLANTNVKKIGQNIKYEENWSVVRLGQSIADWVWDTMLASHILDNRTGVTGLKFQTYVQFGIPDYSSEVDPYLQSVDNTNNNSMNKLLEHIETPGIREKILKYCALDAIHTYRLAEEQMNIIYERKLPF